MCADHDENAPLPPFCARARKRATQSQLINSCQGTKAACHDRPWGWKRSMGHIAVCIGVKLPKLAICCCAQLTTGYITGGVDIPTGWANNTCVTRALAHLTFYRLKMLESPLL